MAKDWTSTIDVGPITERYRGVAEAVVDYGVDLVAKRSLRNVPRRTGKTAASESHGREGTRGYVAYHSRKARALHDNTAVRHRRGRAKFLETELVGSVGAIRRRAVAEFRAATQGGRQ